MSSYNPKPYNLFAPTMNFFKPKNAEEARRFYRTLNGAYYRGEPIMTDGEYETCFKVYQGLIPPPDDPIWTESFEELGVRKVEHTSPMLSTQKFYPMVDGVDEFRGWLSNLKSEVGEGDTVVAVTPKYDGIAARIYPDGKVATRGTGTVGSDITHWASCLNNYEHHPEYRKMSEKRGLGSEVTGEIVMSKDDFFILEPNGDPGKIRNVVAGALKPDAYSDSSIRVRESGFLTFVPFSLARTTGNTLDALLEMDDDRLGKEIEQWVIWSQESKFPLDGLVVEVLGLRDELGSSNGKYWDWQCAIKLRNETAWTTVTDITLQVGRTGRITPVMHVEPVQLSGASVSKATVHSKQTMFDLGVEIGKEVELVRSGEVIPYIIGVRGTGQGPVSFEKCPVCVGDVEDAGAYAECINDVCPAKLVKRVIHLIQSIGGIDHFGESTVSDMVDLGIITQISDVFSDSFTEQMLCSKGISGGIASRLIKQIESARSFQIDENKILAGMGIRHLGRTMSKTILQHFRSEDLGSLSEESLQNLPGIDKTASQVLKGLQSSWDEYMSILNFFPNRKRVLTQEEKALMGDFVSGKTICFTGTMKKGKRKDMEADSESRGATVKSSVTKALDILVFGEKAGSKKSKAEKINSGGGSILILSEKEYLNSSYGLRSSNS